MGARRYCGLRLIGDLKLYGRLRLLLDNSRSVPYRIISDVDTDRNWE